MITGSSNIARNIIMDFHWFYRNVNQTLTPALEQYIVETLYSKFEQLNDIAKSYTLQRAFCPSDDCSQIDITVLDQGNRIILAHFYAENV